MKIASLTFLLLSITCQGSGPTGANFSIELSLRAGQTATAGDARVRFAELVNESRCPSTVVCVWQGNARIRVELISAGKVESVDLNTAGGPTFPQEAAALGYRVRLLDLQPYPQDTGPHEGARYQARILVSRE